MRPVRPLLLAIVLALCFPASAEAASVDVIALPSPLPEDVPFATDVHAGPDFGTVRPRVIAAARPVAGLPCAATPDADPGQRVMDQLVRGIEHRGEVLPRTPGDHLVCAWLVDAAGRVLAGPDGEVVAIRPPALNAFFVLPRWRLRPGHVHDVRVEYRSEAPRRLHVYLARGTTCDIDTAPIEVPDEADFQELADVQLDRDLGWFTAAVTPYRWGPHVLCARLFDPDVGTTPPSGASIQRRIHVGGPRRRCAAVRGARRIAVGGISCTRGRSIARRWVRAARPPRTISGLRCRRLPSRRVRCAADEGEVTFRHAR